jgi:transposase
MDIRWDSPQPEEVGGESVHGKLPREQLELGLSTPRIDQDWVREHGFIQGDDRVKRFVRSLIRGPEPRFRRWECEPGAEAQVDVGQGAPNLNAASKRRSPYVLRAVLSHRRQPSREVVDRQTTENLIRCWEDGFWHFGGVPRIIALDNLHAAVNKADGFDPELNSKVRSFAEHDETAFPPPTRGKMPRHQGRVERGVDYVPENVQREPITLTKNCPPMRARRACLNRRPWRSERFAPENSVGMLRDLVASCSISGLWVAAKAASRFA